MPKKSSTTVAAIAPHTLTFHALTPDRWNDLVTLFGERGACGGCWCMSWRLNRADFDAGKGDKNRRAFKRLVDKAAPTGVLAYANSAPIGWCSVAPREDFIRLENARTLKRLDDKPVWSVVCLFVAKPYRSQGISVALLKAAADWAKSQGATLIEGYPTEPSAKLPDPFVWTGLASAFRKAGFKEVARPAKTRPIFRKGV
ncbi:MAG TPA: GNAT family N-acetyltransferase [Terriglobales bacterium]|nr:GNAT family N-acetyltransferase [Terriglobales bacterium]